MSGEELVHELVEQAGMLMIASAEDYLEDMLTALRA